jgi:DNA-directed RNA polymerase beta' subunit
MKAMEDVGVRYDGTVRNSCGDVLQFVYGEDGMDASCVESQVCFSSLLIDFFLLKKTETTTVARYCDNVAS